MNTNNPPLYERREKMFTGILNILIKENTLPYGMILTAEEGEGSKYSLEIRDGNRFTKYSISNLGELKNALFGEKNMFPDDIAKTEDKDDFIESLLNNLGAGVSNLIRDIVNEGKESISNALTERKLSPTKRQSLVRKRESKKNYKDFINSISDQEIKRKVISFSNILDSDLFIELITYLDWDKFIKLIDDPGTIKLLDFLDNHNYQKCNFEQLCNFINAVEYGKLVYILQFFDTRKLIAIINTLGKYNSSLIELINLSETPKVTIFLDLLDTTELFPFISQITDTDKVVRVINYNPKKAAKNVNRHGRIGGFFSLTQ